MPALRGGRDSLPRPYPGGLSVITEKSVKSSCAKRARRIAPIAGFAGLVAGAWLISSDGKIEFSSGAAEAASAEPTHSQSASAIPTRPVTTQPRRDATESALSERVLRVESGDTMINILQGAGLTAREAFKAIHALKDIYSPRDLRPGQQIRVALAKRDNESGSAQVELASLRLRASAELDVALDRSDDDDFIARKMPRQLDRQIVARRGTIETSLMAAANAKNVAMKPLLRVIRGFSYAVDFQRDLRKGNDFEVLYETYTDAQSGEQAKVGGLLYAALNVREERHEMYRFEQDSGRVRFFNGNGESVRRLLMRTPINGARLSSGYGMRKHPILGYSRMHEGVDFAAPRGTPIYAAGNGRVEYAGWNGSYGRYVRIDHQGPYKTAYAHMKGVASGVHGGAQVSQGDIIGYAGSTGNSTGPHLHYEILKHGKAVNPRNLNLPTGYRLKGDELARFQQVKAEIDRQRQQRQDTRVASATCEAATETDQSSC